MVAKNGFDADDPRLSAYALGELDEGQRAEVEALLARDAAARSFVEELREAAAALEAGFAAEAKPVLTVPQRERILAGAAHVALARPRRWRLVLASSALAAGLALTLGALAWQMQGGSTETALARVEAVLSPPAGTAAPARRATELAFAPKQQSAQDSLRALGYAGGTELRMGLDSLGYAEDVQSGGAVPQTLEDPGHGEDYAAIVENRFIATADEPVSTFSIDVDTASYANVRRFLLDGARPPADAVRIEELINYFDYDYPPPSGSAPFAVDAEVAGCPWNPRHQLVRIALKGREVQRHERNASNLVFLLDVSGSMDDARKLPLVVESLKLLVQQLDVRDRVAIVVYAGSSGLVLDSTSARERATIVEALERLHAGGSTNGGEGIQLAYRLAREHFVAGGTNRVILCTDGDFNVGVTSHEALVELIESERESGVFLSVLGFGSGNLKDATMEQLADKGNGNYAYIDSLSEARKVLVEQVGGTLETLAKDVKIQVAFNPAHAQAYRLVGYENRVLANRDFDDDTKDAGEIGAGHCVTALYEVVPVGVPFTPEPVERVAVAEPNAAAQPELAFGDELALVRLRFKAPDADESRLISSPLPARSVDFARASVDFRFAATVAAFGMKLRNSRHTAALSFEDIARLASAALGRDERRYRVEFVDLVERAARLR